METHGGKIEGPFAIDRDLTIHGMIAGQATVRSEAVGLYCVEW